MWDYFEVISNECVLMANESPWICIDSILSEYNKVIREKIWRTKWNGNWIAAIFYADYCSVHDTIV